MCMTVREVLDQRGPAGHTPPLVDARLEPPPERVERFLRPRTAILHACSVEHPERSRHPPRVDEDVVLDRKLIVRVVFGAGVRRDVPEPTSEPAPLADDARRQAGEEESDARFEERLVVLVPVVAGLNGGDVVTTEREGGVHRGGEAAQDGVECAAAVSDERGIKDRCEG